MSDTAYLALYFDAPLQSWGYASKFDRRTTLAHPTRSGVLGLLCAALGVDRSDTQELARLDDSLGVEVYVFRLGSRLTDYHTVGGGYDPKREPLRICKKASGGIGNTVQTWREYLEEARFGVVVSGPSDLIADMAQAVRNPVWGLWLGRKSCVPASRVFEGVHADTDSALAALRNAFGDIDAVVARKVAETESYAEGNDTLMDRPIDFAKRRFASRRIMVE
jgi:CRISPR system Cascade subunit CasD